MSGTIQVTPTSRWSAAGWLFDWTVEFLASRVRDPKVSAGLREVVSENLGWVGLDHYGPDTRDELVALIRRDLVSHAERELPGSVPNRPAALALLRELAELTPAAE
ncbi:MAG TPA: hypothetical protein VGJ63_20310 [Micromonosporaceae bacterium]|jgi:hypothetical protein